MPIFEIEGADGQIYEVDAPDQASAVQAFTQFQPPTVQESGVAQQGRNLDEFYSTGIYGGEYNPLGAIARTIGAGAQGIQDVTTFGFGDELLGATVPGATIEGERARNEAIQASNPWAYGAGQVAGGLGLAARLGPALPTSQVAANAPLAARVGASALEGGAMGGLYGVGSGEGTADRVAEGVFGAATGGAIGGLVPAISSGVSSGIRNWKDLGARSTVAQNAGVSPETAGVLEALLASDDTLGPAGMAAMQRAGADAMPVDAGISSKSLFDTIMATGGKGASVGRQRVGERLTKASKDLTAALDDTLGSPEGMLTAQRDIRRASSAAVGDVYENAYKMPINYASDKGQRVEEVISRIPNRIKSAAIQKANERMVAEGRVNQQLMADIADDGTVTFRQMPNVEQVDAMKRALDDIINDGTDIGGKMSSDAQLATGLKRQLRDALADAVPEYSTALKTAADPISRQKAIGTGYDLMRTSTTRDRASIMLEGMTDPEKKAVASGVRSYIDDMMANVKRTMANPDTDPREAAKAIKELSSRASEEKLTLILGDQQAKKLIDEIDRISTAFELEASVAKGSQTFTRTELDRQLKEMRQPGAIGLLAQGKPGQAGQDVIQSLTGQTPERVLAQDNAVRAEIADWLTRSSDVAIPQFKAMTDYSTQTAANAARSAEIARLLSMGQRGVYPATVATTN